MPEFFWSHEVVKKVLFLLIFIILSPISALSVHSEKLSTPSGVTVEINYRVLQRGEVIVVKINDDWTVKEVHIQFLENKYFMAKSKNNSSLLAFVGLDLNLEPGTYTMEFFIDKTSGGKEYIQTQIPILENKFPLRRLWVPKEFVVPPPEFHERIREEAEMLRALYGKITPKWHGEGRFIIPSSGKVHKNFGDRRIFNDIKRSTHGGVDITAPRGAPIIASNSGRIVLARDLYYAGKAVIIDHGLGLFTLSCHFSKITVEEGDLVRKGDLIGEIGSTGRVTGPHLHWGVKVFGNRIDPFSLLSLNLD